MSLIIDIDPVPWNVLEVVKCRILKNRAKAKRAVENCGGSEKKRADSLRPGPLSRKRKDEPSFVLSGDTPYIAIVTGGQYGHRVFSDVFDTGVYPTLNGSLYGGFYGLDTIKIPIYSVIGKTTVNLNGVAIGQLANPGVNNFVAYLFMWSENTNTQNEIISNIETSEWTNRYSPYETDFGDEGFNQYLVTLTWKIILIDKSKFAEPEPGVKIKFELVPDSPIQFRFGNFYHVANTSVYTNLAGDTKPVGRSASTAIGPYIGEGIPRNDTEGFIFQFSDIPGERKYWPLNYVFQ